MKKWIASIVCFLLLFAQIAQMQETDWPAEDEIDFQISDDQFVAQYFDMSMNPEKYDGLLIVVYGYVTYLSGGTDAPFTVSRDLNCCGDGPVAYSFDCKYAGELPENGSWVEVAGYFSLYRRETGYQYPLLDLVAVKEAEPPAVCYL